MQIPDLKEPVCIRRSSAQSPTSAAIRVRCASPNNCIDLDLESPFCEDMPPPPHRHRRSAKNTVKEAMAQDSSYDHRVVLMFDLHGVLPKATVPKALNSLILLDATASMKALGDTPKVAVNAYIAEQAKSGFAGLKFTLIAFNTRFKVLCHDRPVTEPVTLDYKCKGMTALYDALRFGMQTANETKEVVVVTDGQDNSSLTNQSELNGLMRRANECGWRFTFVGCNTQAMQPDLPFETSFNVEAANRTLSEMMQSASTEVSLRNDARTK